MAVDFEQVKKEIEEEKIKRAKELQNYLRNADEKEEKERIFLDSCTKMSGVPALNPSQILLLGRGDNLKSSAISLLIRMVKHVSEAFQIR